MKRAMRVLQEKSHELVDVATQALEQEDHEFAADMLDEAVECKRARTILEAYDKGMLMSRLGE